MLSYFSLGPGSWLDLSFFVFFRDGLQGLSELPHSELSAGGFGLGSWLHLDECLAAWSANCSAGTVQICAMGMLILCALENTALLAAAEQKLARRQ